jgi:hypothetical protein
MQTAGLGSMPTLDEGGLAVRQVGGDPNRGIRIPGTSPDSQQRADQGPGGSCHGGSASAGKGKEKEPVPIRKGGEEHSIPTHKDDEVRGAATTGSSQEHKEARSWRLHRGDGSFMGEPAPKRQETAGSGGRAASGLHPHRRNASSHRGGQRRRGV